MAETPNHITIQVDEDALRKQVEDAVARALEDMSMRLRQAADVLDANRWIKEFDEYHEERMKGAYERGVAAGRELKEEGD